MTRSVLLKRIIGLICIVLALFALGQIVTGSLAAPAAPESAAAIRLSNGRLPSSLLQDPTSDEGLAAVNCSSTTCPSGPADLDKCVERPKFCVYYTTDSISQSEAEWAADTVQDYWDRFTALGFLEPKYSTKLKVELTDTTDCNGGTGWSSNGMSTYAGCFDVTLLAQKVLGHELTHRVQYAHDSGSSAPVQTKFLKEGTARATEDNWFTEIDHWAAALSHSSFNSEVNNYLASTNYDITSYAMRYRSSLWWKYAMEQYGTTVTEPERGIDFIRQVYNQNTAGYSGISAVNHALAAMGAGTTFDNSFKQFAVANWAKDLNGVSSTYNYLDEDEAGNPGPYGPVIPTAGGTIQIGTSANWNNQPVDRYGLRYYSADVGSNCPVVSASFHRDASSPAFYQLITQNGGDLNTHVQGSGADWSQAFLNDGITQVTAIVGSLENSSQVDLTLECADPVLEIMLPNSIAVARVQPVTKFLAQVQVTDGASGPVVAGLNNSDFVATVDGMDAPVTGGGFIQEQYWLLIQAPTLADGTYDLEVTLEEPGTGTPLDSDTSPDSVVYTADLIDQVLVIDQSGSMGVGTPTRLSAAQDAASFYVDVTRDDDGLSVVPYNQDVNPLPFNMAVVDSSVRNAAKTYINSLGPSGLTSIGDGLNGALSQLAGSPTENPLCSFVLLSDGMENTSLFWTNVMTDVVDSGCPVTTIAFGPESDETLMQEIATETGGLYFYNDVYISSASVSDATAAITPADMALDLGGTYEYAEGKAEGRQRLLAEKGTLSEQNPEAKYAVMVDETISEVVFALDWYETSYADLVLVLMDPAGNTYDMNDPGYTFMDTTNHHVGFRIPRPEPGLWQMIVGWKGSEEASVPYQVLVSGKSYLTLELLLPDRLGTRYYTGDRVPLYAILSSQEPLASVIISGTVTAPNGTETMVPFYDDGEHGDGAVNDGLYVGYYTAVNQAEVVYPSEDPQSEPNDEGGYRVMVRATQEKFQREALGAFSVLEGPDENQNRLPDPFERAYGVSDPTGDPDLDKLNTYDEYMNGTDPTNPDTDGGGEQDGSEVSWGRDPLDPGDDGIPKPDFFQVRPLNAGVLLRFDHNPAYNFLRFYRGTNPDGPWGEVFTTDPSLPPSGYFTDTHVINNTTYFYRMEGVTVLLDLAGDQHLQANAAAEITSAVLSSEAVTPSEDPLPPEALIIIDDGAQQTSDPNVTLSFAPYESEGSDAAESFDDIALMLLSNDPTFMNAEWQPFDQDVPWVLDAELGEIATVYARFRDKSDNETIGTEMDMILYDNWKIYLPMSFR
jgi:hypothetical protein